MRLWRQESFFEFLRAVIGRAPEWMLEGIDPKRQVYITDGVAHISVENIPSLGGIFIQLAVSPGGDGGRWTLSLLEWLRENGIKRLWFEGEKRALSLRRLRCVEERGEGRCLYELILGG
jgi:hypothetical protein